MKYENMIKHILYRLIQWTWGFPQTLVGALLYLKNKGERHLEYHGSCVTVWKSKSSISLGMFVFITDDPLYYYDSHRNSVSEEDFSKMLLVHEFGHTIQSLIFGPLYLFAVGIPSTIWSFFPYFVKLRDSGRISYFSVYPERWANQLGEWITGEKSIGDLV